MEYVQDKDEKVTIHITGDAMSSTLGFELKYLLNVLISLEKMIEKTYLFSEGGVRMSPDDYEKLKVIMDEPKKGSFDANIFIQLVNNALPLVPWFAENGIAIWKSITQVYEYLKLFIDTRKEGKEVAIEQDGSENIIVTGNNNTITVNKNIPELANELSPYMAQMASNIDGEKVENISLTSDHDSDFNLTPEDRERFKSKTFLNDEYSSYEGKVVSSDSKRDKGELETNEGTFTFYIHDNIASESVHDEIYLNRVKLKCREKIRIDPSKELIEEVLSLEVYDFEVLRDN